MAEAPVQQIFLTRQNVIMYCACISRVTMYWRLGRNISTRSIKCKKRCSTYSSTVKYHQQKLRTFEGFVFKRIQNTVSVLACHVFCPSDMVDESRQKFYPKKQNIEMSQRRC